MMKTKALMKLPSGLNNDRKLLKFYNGTYEIYDQGVRMSKGDNTFLRLRGDEKRLTYIWVRGIACSHVGHV